MLAKDDELDAVLCVSASSRAGYAFTLGRQGRRNRE
jgi:hypothetical protein